MTRIISATVLALLLSTPVFADAIRFDKNWREQGFLKLFTNDYGLNGSRLDVVSDQTVSLLWSPAPQTSQGAKNATWSWNVAESVQPTDLRRKGGDDRNLALYFIFTTQEGAEAANPRRAIRLLRDENTHGIVYVWGGNHRRGSVLQSPYHPRIKTIVLRGAGTGSHSENVDLAADYQRAFGKAPEVLLGLGVSADSDDTDGFIRGSISNLTLR